MSTINYKKKSCIILIPLGLCILAYSAIFIYIILVDPLQIAKKGYFDSTKMSSNMRIQAAGIINNHPFDSIILGTSMLENSSAKMASEKLGGTFVNISIYGTTFAEREIPFQYALKKGLYKVIYSLDIYYLEVPAKSTSVWDILYDDDCWNDLKVYLAFAKDLTSLGPRDMDRPTAWDLSDTRFGGIANWVRDIELQSVEHLKEFMTTTLPKEAQLSIKKSNTSSHDLGREAKSIQYIEDTILEHVKAYPKTNFYFIFPPYFKYTYAAMRQNKPEDFFIHQAVIRHMVEASTKYPNVFVYGFESEAFTFDIARYIDTYHYDTKINDLFIDSIAANKNLLTPENVEAYLEECEQQAYDFDIIALNDEFIEAVALWKQEQALTKPEAKSDKKPAQ